MAHSFFTVREKQQIIPIWDYHGMLESIGSNAEIIRRFEAAGYDPPTAKAINGWRFRGRIPSQWLPLLLKWSFMSGGSIKSFDDLLIKDEVVL